MRHGLRIDLKGALMRAWYRLPFVRRRGGPGLAGVREPRRPGPPTMPPLAQAAEPPDEAVTSSVVTLSRPVRHWWRRLNRHGRPRAGQI